MVAMVCRLLHQRVAISPCHSLADEQVSLLLYGMCALMSMSVGVKFCAMGLASVHTTKHDFPSIKAFAMFSLVNFFSWNRTRRSRVDGVVSTAYFAAKCFYVAFVLFTVAAKA